MEILISDGQSATAMGGFKTDHYIDDAWYCTLELSIRELKSSNKYM